MCTLFKSPAWGRKSSATQGLEAADEETAVNKSRKRMMTEANFKGTKVGPRRNKALKSIGGLVASTP
jgi:hypothetical protein